MCLEKKVDLIIAEYNTLRDEISARSNKELISITISISAVSAIIGVISINYIAGYNLSILLIIPWILSFFGYIWLDHSKSISFIGDFIYKEIENKKISTLFTDEKFNYLSWESSLQKEIKDVRKKTLFFWISRKSTFVPLFYFIIPSIFSLIVFFVYNGCKINYIQWIISFVDIYLIIFLIIIWLTRLIKYR
jgi:hypothetical protein